MERRRGGLKNGLRDAQGADSGTKRFRIAGQRDIHIWTLKEGDSGDEHVKIEDIDAARPETISGNQPRGVWCGELLSSALSSDLFCVRLSAVLKLKGCSKHTTMYTYHFRGTNL